VATPSLSPVPVHDGTKELAPERPPIVELAPDFAIPGESPPAAAPPQPSVPGVLIPRNIVPPGRK
jgi:hypothetical protein